MTLQEYQIKSKRTMASLGSMDLDLSHCVIGIHSEFSEVCEGIDKRDNVNIGEEISDKFFYLANYCTFRDLDLSYFYSKHPFTVDSELEKYLIKYCKKTSDLQDLVKKYIAYKKPINVKKEADCITAIVFILQRLVNYFSLNLEQILQNNVNKLLVRFPLEFTETLANNRNLYLERKELEK